MITAQRRRRIDQLLPVVPVGAALLLLAGSVVPHARVKAVMDSLSPDGDAEAFTREFHAAVAANVRIAAVLLLLAGALLFRFRRPITGAISARLSRARAYVARGVREGADALQRDRLYAGLLAAVVLAGAGLRARWLDQPINYDESFTYITYVSRPLIVGLSDYGYLNNHLLHTLLAHISTALFGNAPWALRLPAYMAGCALIPLSYALAHRFSGAAAGVLAAALVAVNPVLMEFSACARGYSLVTACFLAIALIACDLIRNDDEGAWTCLAVVAALGFFAVPVFVYPFGVVMLWIVLARGQSGRLDLPAVRAITTAIAITLALVGLVYAAPLGISGVPERWQFTAPPQSIGSFVASLGQTLPGTWLDISRGMPAGLVVLVGAGAVAALLSASRYQLRLLIVAAVACPAAAVLVQRVVAPARAWQFLLPLLFVASAAGWMMLVGLLDRRGAQKKGTAEAGHYRAACAGAVAAVLITATWAWQPPMFDETGEPEERLMKLDSEPIALFLGDELGPTDAVVSGFPLDYPIEYYVRRHGLPFSLLTRPPAGASRYIVVANDRLGQGVGQVLARASVDPAPTATIRPLTSFTYSTLYEMTLTLP